MRAGSNKKVPCGGDYKNHLFIHEPLLLKYCSWCCILRYSQYNSFVSSVSPPSDVLMHGLVGEQDIEVGM